MYGLKKMLVEEQKRLQDIIRKAKAGEETFPEGYLRISSDKVCVDAGDDKENSI